MYASVALLLVLSLASRGFYPGTTVFPSPEKKQHFQIAIRFGLFLRTPKCLNNQHPYCRNRSRGVEGMFAGLSAYRKRSYKVPHKKCSCLNPGKRNVSHKGHHAVL